MSMKLGIEDVLAVQAAMREIKGMQVKVTEFVVAEHRILLTWVNEEPSLIGIMQIGEHKSGGAVRDGSVRRGASTAQF
jgi:hypothetical protein